MTEYIDREALLDDIDEEIEYESSMYTKEEESSHEQGSNDKHSP